MCWWPGRTDTRRRRFDPEYDDSDGLYDYGQPPLVNASNTARDALTGPGACGQSQPGADQGRCGYGPRLPLLVISPYAKRNFVDHTLTDQSSIIRFIEDNWGLRGSAISRSTSAPARLSTCSTSRTAGLEGCILIR